MRLAARRGAPHRRGAHRTCLWGPGSRSRAGSLERVSLWLRELAQERVRVALAAERGDPHVARVNGRLGRIGADQRLDRGQQRRPVAAGQVDAPDRALEQHVAGEQRPLVGQRIADVSGAVAGREA